MNTKEEEIAHLLAAADAAVSALLQRDVEGTVFVFNDPQVQDAVMALRDAFCYGLQESFWSSPPVLFWSFVESLPKLLPSAKRCIDAVRAAPKSQRDAKIRIDVFTFYALHQGSLLDFMTTLTQAHDKVAEYFHVWAILASPIHAPALLDILAPLDSLQTNSDLRLKESIASSTASAFTAAREPTPENIPAVVDATAGVEVRGRSGSAGAPSGAPFVAGSADGTSIQRRRGSSVGRASVGSPYGSYGTAAPLSYDDDDDDDDDDGGDDNDGGGSSYFGSGGGEGSDSRSVGGSSFEGSGTIVSRTTGLAIPVGPSARPAPSEGGEFPAAAISKTPVLEVLPAGRRRKKKKKKTNVVTIGQAAKKGGGGSGGGGGGGDRPGLWSYTPKAVDDGIVIKKKPVALGVGKYNSDSTWAMGGSGSALNKPIAKPPTPTPADKVAEPDAPIDSVVVAGSSLDHLPTAAPPSPVTTPAETGGGSGDASSAAPAPEVALPAGSSGDQARLPPPQPASDSAAVATTLFALKSFVRDTCEVTHARKHAPNGSNCTDLGAFQDGYAAYIKSHCLEVSGANATVGEPMVERVMAQYAARVEVAHSEAHRPSGRCVVGITPRDGSHIHELPGAGDDASVVASNTDTPPSGMPVSVSSDRISQLDRDLAAIASTPPAGAEPVAPVRLPGGGAAVPVSASSDRISQLDRDLAAIAPSLAPAADAGGGADGDHGVADKWAMVDNADDAGDGGGRLTPSFDFETSDPDVLPQFEKQAPSGTAATAIPAVAAWAAQGSAGDTEAVVSAPDTSSPAALAATSSSIAIDAPSDGSTSGLYLPTPDAGVKVGTPPETLVKTTANVEKKDSYAALFSRVLKPANETIGASAIPPPGEWGSVSGGGNDDDDADAIGGSSERPYGRSYDEFHDAHAADDTVSEASDASFMDDRLMVRSPDTGSFRFLVYRTSQPTDGERVNISAFSVDGVIGQLRSKLRVRRDAEISCWDPVIAQYVPLTSLSQFSVDNKAKILVNDGRALEDDPVARLLRNRPGAAERASWSDAYDSNGDGLGTSGGGVFTRGARSTSGADARPYYEDDGFDDDGPSVASQWFPPRMKVFFEEPVMEVADVCHGCGVAILKSSDYRLCEYFQRRFCRGCHTKSKSVIPARVLHAWDFRLYKVSNIAKKFLRDIAEEPVFNVRVSSRETYQRLEVQQCTRIREQLFYLRELAMACRDRDALLEPFRGRQYLMESTDLYSFNDLRCLTDGTLLRFLIQQANDLMVHVMECPLCMWKGHICEYCQSNTPVYAFDLAAVIKCGACWSFYHRDCFVPGTCPKCKRIAEREARRADEVPVDYQTDTDLAGVDVDTSLIGGIEFDSEVMNRPAGKRPASGFTVVEVGTGPSGTAGAGVWE